MRINWNHIKIIGLLAIVVFLYAFTSQRNNKRKVAAPIIEFVDDQKPFVTHATVSKLLIQNQQPITSVPKETLDLNGLEQALNAHKMIENAEVFLRVNGGFSVKIKQKKPIARVSSSGAYYIDSTGGLMPLSTNYTARVPMVTGHVKQNDLAVVYTIASRIMNDSFLKTNVIEIHQNRDKSIDLKLRQCQFTVHLGSLNYLDKKINNLKAFYNKAIKDKSLEKYSKVNLQFENQVVCTKV
ncbi:cell division protein FtsQ/DivIB [Lacinutrix neustonica]|uniref:Cell division protein FtsQ/DivIB n=1 Tax=Lacinutrix neustonica TaxID=2980107 RepID=A0A9E8MW88_9FLAO|nr:cell division protein FtsQ/DivIB [Lacinutrix neustonica]WAC01440.1 cell division protein FtsQ/DivIB [Lacinutrix neustonica]